MKKLLVYLTIWPIAIPLFFVGAVAACIAIVAQTLLTALERLAAEIVR